jgi:DNA-binding response OmpR family regulator
MKVLVIDDDKLVLYTVSRILRNNGDEVLTAQDGREGMALFRRERPDVVITDIVMPEQEGLGTIMQMRREYPEARILAISGGLRSHVYDVLSIAAKLGADEVLTKPFEPRQLLDRLRSLMMNKAQPPVS